MASTQQIGFVKRLRDERGIDPDLPIIDNEVSAEIELLMSVPPAGVDEQLVEDLNRAYGEYLALVQPDDAPEEPTQSIDLQVGEPTRRSVLKQIRTLRGRMRDFERAQQKAKIAARYGFDVES